MRCRLLLCVAVLSASAFAADERIPTPEGLKSSTVRVLQADPDEGWQRLPWPVLRTGTPIDGGKIEPGALATLKDDPRIQGVWLSAHPYEVESISGSFRVEFDASHVAELKPLTYLRSVAITGVDLSGQGALDFLSDMRNLERVGFRDCNVDCAEVLAALPECPRLTHISVASRNITVEGDWFIRRDVVPAKLLQRLARTSPKLEHIYVSTFERFPESGLLALAKPTGWDRIDFIPAGINFRNGRRLPWSKPTDEQMQAHARIAKVYETCDLQPWNYRHPPQSYRVIPSLIHVDTKQPLRAPRP